MLFKEAADIMSVVFFSPGNPVFKEANCRQIPSFFDFTLSFISAANWRQHTTKYRWIGVP